MDATSQAIIGIIVSLVGGLFASTLYILLRRNSKEEIKPFLDYQDAVNERVKAKDKTEEDVTDVVQQELTQLTQYYIINRNQARNSFYFSILASFLGMGILIYGIWFFLSQNSPNLTVTALTSISGILLQFISTAFFFLYKTSIDQLNKFFAKLNTIQDTALAIQLSKELSTPPEKHVELTEKIILTLLERSSSEPSEVLSNRIHNIIINRFEEPSRQPLAPLNTDIRNDRHETESKIDSSS